MQMCILGYFLLLSSTTSSSVEAQSSCLAATSASCDPITEMIQLDAGPNGDPSTHLLQQIAVPLTAAQLSSDGDHDGGDDGHKKAALDAMAQLKRGLDELEKLLDAPSRYDGALLEDSRSNETHAEFKQQNITCTEGNVFLSVTEDETVSPPPYITNNIPKGMCFQHLLRSGGSTFWEGRTNAVLQYLQQQTKVEFVVLTDTDVYLNPMSWEDVKSRFDKIATLPAKILVSIEQTCWFGKICSSAEADDWLSIVRKGAVFSGHETLTSFPNSQYMGEANAVKDMLSSVLKISPMDDQQGIGMTIKQNPSLFALDSKEQLFVSMARGLTRNETGHYMCNFGGKQSSRCDWNSWAGCTYKDGHVKIRVDGQAGSPAEDRNPLVVHINGPGSAQIRAGHGCEEALAQALGGQLPTEWDN